MQVKFTCILLYKTKRYNSEKQNPAISRILFFIDFSQVRVEVPESTPFPVTGAPRAEAQAQIV